MVNQARNRGNKPRANLAVSAVIANLIMVSITMAIGFALWTSVNTTAGTTLQRNADQTVNDVNELNEDFVITLIAFDYPLAGNVTVWFYNNGGLETEIRQVFFGNVSSSLVSIIFSPNPLTLPVKQSGSITFTNSTSIGETYYLRTVAKYGSIASSYEAK